MSDSGETRGARVTKTTYSAIIIDGHRHENRGDNLTDTEEDELKFADERKASNNSPLLQSEVSFGKCFQTSCQRTINLEALDCST